MGRGIMARQEHFFSVPLFHAASKVTQQIWFLSALISFVSLYFFSSLSFIVFFSPFASQVQLNQAILLKTVESLPFNCDSIQLPQ